jgi:hypothetical protein
MAASVMATAPAPHRPSTAPPASASPQAANHFFVPGAVVIVHWADGNRYPGTVLQVAPYHVFVVFPNGVQQWVDTRYVTDR